MGIHVDGLPESYKRATQYDEMSKDDLLSNYNLAKGYAYGQAMRLDELVSELAEYKEMVSIARAYQREVDAKLIEGLKHNTEVDTAEEQTWSGDVIVYVTYTTQTYYTDVPTAIRNQKDY